VPVAEEAGLVPALTRRMLKLVARDLDGTFQEFPLFYISVNLSSEDIHDDAIVDQVLELQKTTGARSGNLMVEVTERALATPEHARGVIHQLRTSGISAAVDDFGTGYSSLSYIESFDLDVLKIDKFFIDTIVADESATSRKVMLHIIEIARSLGLRLIAEGVETEAQKRFLLDNGVQYAQGWLYSKPMKMSELLRAMRSPGQAKRHLALID